MNKNIRKTVRKLLCKKSKKSKIANSDSPETVQSFRNARTSAANFFEISAREKSNENSDSIQDNATKSGTNQRLKFSKDLGKNSAESTDFGKNAKAMFNLKIADVS